MPGITYTQKLLVRPSPVKQECRNHSSIHIHCNDPEQGKASLKQKSFSADNKRQNRVCSQCQHCSDNCSRNRDICTGNQIIFLQYRDIIFPCKFSRFFRAFCPFLRHSFTDCQIMKLPASVRPPAALIRTSLPLFSVLWYSFLPMVVPSSPDARSRHISNGNPRRPAGSPTHGCRTGAAF